MNFDAKPNDGFFAIALTDWMGITDKLWHLSKLHPLGRALSYNYVHTPFSCVRSSASSYWGMALLRYSRNLAAVTHTQPYKSDYIGKFLALERRALNINDLAFKNYKKVEISLDNIFQNQKITNLDELREIINSFDRSKNTIKVFTTYQGIYSYVDAIAQLLEQAGEKKDYFRELEVAKYYWLARSKKPINSGFLPGKVKLLVHIRNGDMASFKIGGKTLSTFCYSVQIIDSKDALDSSRKPIELQKIFNLLEAIFQTYTPDKFSVVVISDGYHRSLEVVFRALLRREIKLNPLEVLALLKEVYRSEQRLKSFSSIGNTSTIIGESRQKLLKSIHAIAQADIVIPTSGYFSRHIQRFLRQDDSAIFLNMNSLSEQDLAAIGNLISSKTNQSEDENDLQAYP
ncbi:hypothetical protein [Leptolyngbya sp. FACHB-1515]